MKRAAFALILFLAVAASLSGQVRHRRIPRYGIFDVSKNIVQFPGGKGAEFDTFLGKMDTLVRRGYGDLRIVHIGGSHVQAGVWTAQLRRNLLALRYGLDGGFGLVFPYSAAGTNTPMSYCSSATGTWTFTRCLKPDPAIPLGVSGIEVSTSDPAATVLIDLTERNAREWSPSFTFRSVDVLGTATAGETHPVVIMDRDTLKGVYNGSRWHFDLPHYTEYIRVGFKGFPGSFSLTGLYLDTPAEGLTVSGIGVNGASTWSYLKCRDFERDMALLNPDLVIFSIGINDIQGTEFDPQAFVANYRKIIAKVRKANPRCAFLFTSNNDSYYKGKEPNRFSGDVEEAFRTLAKEYKGGFWDLYDLMGGMGSVREWELHNLVRGDKVHFTTEGYDLLGDLLYNAIMDVYTASIK